MNCRYVASDQPRVLIGRHSPECRTETTRTAMNTGYVGPNATVVIPGPQIGSERLGDTDCPGCLPCPMPHCGCCGRNHVERYICPECIADTRSSIDTIVRECGLLPAEARAKGIESEAFMLNGPVADPEAREHVVMSIARGRVIEADWLTVADSETHPLAVLGTWRLAGEELLAMVGSDAITVQSAADWLDEHLHQLADHGHFAFDELRRDVARCLSHLEAVLHDGEQRDRTQVPCLDCGAAIEKQWAKNEDQDHYLCAGHARHHYDERRFLLARSQWLASHDSERFVPIQQAADAIGRSHETVRTWIKNGDVASERRGVMHVWWPDVREANLRAATRTRALS